MHRAEQDSESVLGSSRREASVGCKSPWKIDTTAGKQKKQSQVPRSELGLVARAQYVTITVLVELTGQTFEQPEGHI